MKQTKTSAYQFGTKISAIEKASGVSFNMPKDMSLGTYLKKKGYASLAQMLVK